ncbi:aldo/keto reductase [Anaeromyxobacter oryzae]|uniref:Oxidoreductase n=1 Tax=Anaeromyxobacter oryzae TaxID=2918170 RepID=A0ABN6MTZ4_9BACT|nr:aldo/keto reductase [Anaeromyxobacter oryzae]BDG04437.1 oxidoreductase [Anaeromyxobacter oryzae]
MEYVSMPGLPFPASRVALGTWAIGGWLWGGTDAADAIRTIHAALDLGVNLVDTAPVYGFGRAEELVGEALAASGRRDRVLVATKCGLDWTRGALRRDASPARIAREVEDSLRRLRVDVIDLYQVHWPDAGVPLDETGRALEGLARAGKIRAIGVSNFTAAQVERFRATAPVATVQPPYNLFERGIDAELLPYCRKEGIATLAYGALCRGLLSGRMAPGTTFQGDDLRRGDPKFRPPRFAQYLAAVAALDALARDRFGRTVLELAVRWLLDQPGVSVALWGARRPSQLDPVPRVFGWRLDDAARARVDQIVREHVTDPVGPEFMAPPDSA